MVELDRSATPQHDLAQAIRVMGGQWLEPSAAGSVPANEPLASYSGAAIDSRRLQAGQLFFALKGEKTDGHRFVEAAWARGAAAVVVDQPVEIQGPCIRVPDVLAALHALTHAVRRVNPQHLIGITGSAGKTTTKELIAAFLARRFRVAKSPGNFNNTLGFPLALLGIPVDTEWMVAEMGMSTPGELGQVSRLGRPDIAVFTNVRPVHLENFGSVEAIARAKAELLDGVPDGGTMVANAEDPRVWSIAERFAQERQGRILTFGFHANPSKGRPLDVQCTRIEPLTSGFGSRFTVRTSWAAEELQFESPLHGAYNVENCLAALACVFPLGLDPADIAAALAEMKPAEHRGDVRRLASGAVLVDDCYNSNPDAAKKALESARHLPGARYFAVLGDMLELGPDEDALHAEVGAKAAQLGFTRVIAVGSRARHLADAVRRAGGAADWLADRHEAEAWAKTLDPRDQDVFLVKASRGMALEGVVAILAGET